MSFSYFPNKWSAGRKHMVWFVTVSFFLWMSTGYAAYFQGGASVGKASAEGRPVTTSEEGASAPALAPKPAKAEAAQLVSPQPPAEPARQQ